MSTRPIAVSSEFDEETASVVVVVDTAFVDDAELDEIKADLKSARDDGSEAPWWLSASLEISEAELFGLEVVRHARIANILNDVGIDRMFSWADDEEPGFVLRIEVPKGAELTPAAIAGALRVGLLCECGRRHEGGALSAYQSDGPSPFAPLVSYAAKATLDGWSVDGPDVACVKCKGRGSDAED